MKKIIQSLKTGVVELVEVPVPSISENEVLIQTSNSLISSGTERMLLEFGRSNILAKAKGQPEKVKMVLQKIKTDGLIPTLEAVSSKLDEPISLGYCNVGRVVEVGKNVANFRVGDRVASNGSHAEFVAVSKNLCAKIPENVDDKAAAFTVVGAIGLQGVRLLNPTLGERIVVIGLGLIGLITIQILRANGCSVLGMDTDRSRVEVAQNLKFNAVCLTEDLDPLLSANSFSENKGVDGVLITANTKSQAPITNAAMMCRQRGRIVLIGVSGLSLSRDEFYKKELSFQVSSSYGPGRYDKNYENLGRDYPFGYVRWTEQRNFEAILELLSLAKIDTEALKAKTFNLADANKAYDELSAGSNHLALMLDYPKKCEKFGKALTTTWTKYSPFSELPSSSSKSASKTDLPVLVDFVGGGTYAKRKLMPAFKRFGAEFNTLITRGGVSLTHSANKFRFKKISTDVHGSLSESKSDAVVIATRHDTHAEYIIAALKCSKHVFVEKPLCLTLEELKQIEAAYDGKSLLLIGFNRRFAPQTAQIKHLLRNETAKKSIIITVNSGAVSQDHWSQDKAVGGGRLVGEACHFIDLLRYIVGSPITYSSINRMRSQTNDTFTLNFTFYDGSIGTIHYFSNGNTAVPKEKLEVFCGGRVLSLQNFKKMEGFGWPKFKRQNLWSQNKGQEEMAEIFLNAIREDGPNPIPVEEIFEVSKLSIELDMML